MQSGEVFAQSKRAIRLVLLGQWVLFSIASAAILGIFARGFVSATYSRTLLLACAAILGLLSWAQLWAAAKGRFRQRVHFAHLLLSQAMWTVIAYLSGGAESGATSLYGVTCLVGGFLLAIPGVVAASISALVFYFLMVVLLQSGALPIPPEHNSASYGLALNESTYNVVANFFILLLVALLATYLIQRLNRAGGALQEAEMRAAEAERMAALGRLAAGLAHEIRNPLSSIAGAVQILRTGIAEVEDRQLCDIVLREAGRLEELVSDMTNLSRPRPPMRSLTNLTEIVRDVVKLAANSGRAGGDVSLRYVGPDSPVWVFLDPSQFRQLVWNLVRNAVQASGAGGEVRVRIFVGTAVVLSVEDDGVGIDSSARIKLFDAFFTTRSQGTGVGLAVVKKIADEHGFSIEVESDQGQGAIFRVLLGPEQPAPEP